MNVVDSLHAFIWRDMTTNNCNSFFIDGPVKVLIDPGHRHLFEHVRKGLGELNLSLEDIDVVMITHGHPDHFEAVQEFPDATLLAMAQEEFEFIKKATGNYYKVREPAFYLQGGDLHVGDHHFQIIPTPGHSPGSISIYWRDYKVLFTGDVIFKRSVGRTDLPGGKGRLLRESIETLATLEVEYLMPGHGEIITGTKNVRENFEIVKRMWYNYLR